MHDKVENNQVPSRENLKQEIQNPEKYEQQIKLDEEQDNNP